jgi:hypothetical protein
MKSLACVGLALGVVGAMFVGCGGDDTTSTPTPGWPYPSETSFCNKLAEVACNDTVVTDCYGSSAASLPDDKAACTEAYKATTNCNPDNLDYHPDKAEECINQIASIWTDAKVDMTELDTAMAVCNQVFFQGLDTGSPCATDTDCDTLGGATCVQKTGQTEGSCQVAHTVGGGQPCDSPSAVCGDDFYCDPSVSACIARANVAAACSAVKPCEQDALCADATNQCVPKTDNGDPCTAAGQCKGGFCDLPRGATEGMCASTMMLATTSSFCLPFNPE